MRIVRYGRGRRGCADLDAGCWSRRRDGEAAARQAGSRSRRDLGAAEDGRVPAQPAEVLGPGADDDRRRAAVRTEGPVRRNVDLKMRRPGPAAHGHLRRPPERAHLLRRQELHDLRRARRLLRDVRGAADAGRAEGRRSRSGTASTCRSPTCSTGARSTTGPPAITARDAGRRRQHRRVRLRPLRVPAEGRRLGDLDRAGRAAAAPQDGHHDDGGASEAAAQHGHELGSGAEVRRRAVHVRAARHRAPDRIRRRPQDRRRGK